VGEVEPLHALGFFSVTKRLEVYQVVVFEYYDPDQYYASLIEDVEELERELADLAASMQGFLDKEEVVLNGERVKPQVTGVDLGFKGTPEEPFLTFFIFFKGKPKKGVNYYENVYAGEEATYPYSAYWFFPPGSKIMEVEVSGRSEIINDNILVIKIEEGDRIAGYEKIVFSLP